VDLTLPGPTAPSSRALSHHRIGDRTVGAQPALFSGILPGDYTRIAATARTREFARGEVLFLEGDAVKQVLLLTSGFVKLNKLGLSGTEVILRLGVPGDVLGALACSRGQPLYHGAGISAVPGTGLGRGAFEVLVERFPVLHENMARILGGHLLELEDRFREVATERVGPRVARQVLRLMEQIGQPLDGAIEIGLSARGAGADDGHHVVHCQPAALSLGIARDGKAAPGSRDHLRRAVAARGQQRR